MRAYYVTPDQISVELQGGETLGNQVGPATFAPGMAAGNAEYDALMAMVAAGQITIEPYRTPPSAVAAVVEQSYRALLRRQADALQAQGRSYEAVKLLLKAGG
jgi:hypothetical protein